MSVRRRLEDAHLLLANGRGDGALLSVCAAISATSRKRYPDRDAMKDHVAFKRFLGEEVPVLTAGRGKNVNVRCPGADTKWYPDEMMPLQDVLYQFVRCQLMHEGQIAENVEFTNMDELSFRVTETAIVLGGKLLPRLMLVSEYAPENADEFPEVARMPPEVAGWLLFGDSRGFQAEYLAERQKRLDMRLRDLRSSQAAE